MKTLVLFSLLLGSAALANGQSGNSNQLKARIAANCQDDNGGFHLLADAVEVNGDKLSFYVRDGVTLTLAREASKQDCTMEITTFDALSIEYTRK